MTHAIEITKDLRSLFGPVRDQGPRPTCLAFAASDTHAGVRAGWDPLSCEFAFYCAQQRAGRPPSLGATLPHMLDALRYDGQPYEDNWPYLATTPNVVNWQPPASVGTRFGREGQSSFASFSAASTCLNAGHPALLLMTLSTCFFTPDAEGVIAPAAGEVPQQSLRHAVIGVALGVVDGEEAILIRNSWGPGWGAAGHAWLAASCVDQRLFGLAVLGEEVDVSRRSAAA